MHNLIKWPVAPICLILAGCGSGGGTGSAGSSAPPPVNTTVTGLVASQTFTNDAVSASLTTRGTTIGASGAASTLQVQYDANTQSYTLTKSGRAQSFTTADRTTAPAVGVTLYQTSNTLGRDSLTLVTTPYFTTPSAPNSSNQYVGLGYWRRDQNGVGQGFTDIDLFTYGLPTAASSTPRTGGAVYKLSAFGFLAQPNAVLRTIKSNGVLNADFASGTLSSVTAAIIEEPSTGSTFLGGGIELTIAAKISSSDGMITGNALFRGDGEPVSGALSGRFYGPAGEELGATFAASNASGTVLTGGFTAQKQPGSPTVNVALTNIVATQLYASAGQTLDIGHVNGLSDPLFGAVSESQSSSVALAPDGSFAFQPPFSPQTTYTTADRAATQPSANFTTYSKTISGNATQLSMYKVGSGNAELALTYLSFGLFQFAPDANGQRQSVAFRYGIATPANLLDRRTGAAAYKGVAYGFGFDNASRTELNIGGTSEFNVDFAAKTMSGNLALKGTPAAGGAAVDFGSFTFSGARPTADFQQSLGLMQGGTSRGAIFSQFFGPDGEEIGARFNLSSGSVVIGGVAAAKRSN